MAGRSPPLSTTRKPARRIRASFLNQKDRLKQIQANNLTVTLTSGMTASTSVRMTVGAGFTAVKFTVFLYRFIRRNDAQAGFASTFHLSNCTHELIPK
jgi:predicted PP-loop superfamily ATPase